MLYNNRDKYNFRIKKKYVKLRKRNSKKTVSIYIFIHTMIGNNF